MDNEKAFDYLDHSFLISILKKFGFGKRIITWIETLLKDQQSCVINGGTTTQYFNLERGTLAKVTQSWHTFSYWC